MRGQVARPLVQVLVYSLQQALRRPALPRTEGMEPRLLRRAYALVLVLAVEQPALGPRGARQVLAKVRVERPAMAYAVSGVRGPVVTRVHQARAFAGQQVFWVLACEPVALLRKPSCVPHGGHATVFQKIAPCSHGLRVGALLCVPQAAEVQEPLASQELFEHEEQQAQLEQPVLWVRRVLWGSRGSVLEALVFLAQAVEQLIF